MFCSECGTHVQDGDHFCNNCGAPLQVSGGIVQQSSTRPPVSLSPSIPPASKSSPVSSSKKPEDPYKNQIQQLKLHIRELKLDLKQITTYMANTRSQYYETAAFVPRGLLRMGDKMLEDFRLLGPQQQKQQLQQQIMQLERQLLTLQQDQAQWKAQQ
jgi:predicted amidophosphoribosyltransferase